MVAGGLCDYEPRFFVATFNRVLKLTDQSPCVIIRPLPKNILIVSPEKQIDLQITKSLPSATTSEIFLLDTGEWINGPELPREYGVGGHVNPDEATLILSGGLGTSGEAFGDILLLDASEAETFSDLKFTTSSVKMQTPRFVHAMSYVYDDDQC